MACQVCDTLVGKSIKGISQAMSIFISAISPVYQAHDNVAELVNQLTEALESLDKPFEIILVEDGSPDNSWEMIERECQKDSRVKGIKLSRNFGQHPAIFAGLTHAAGEWVVVMDCDLQDRPAEIPRLLQKAEEGFDIVQASRMDRQDGFLKSASSRLFYFVLDGLTDVSLDHTVANYGIYSRQVIDELLRFPEKSRSFPLLVRWAGFRRTTIPVTHQERFAGKSSYDFRRAMTLALEIAVSFSNKPLLMCVKLGLAFSFLAVVAALFVMVHAFFGGYVLGWPSLIISIWFLGGILMVMQGVIGIYVGQVFREVKGRPVFLVEQATNLSFGEKFGESLTTPAPHRALVPRKLQIQDDSDSSELLRPSL